MTFFIREIEKNFNLGILNQKKEVDLNIISDEVCEKTQNSGHLIDGAMFCAGYLEGGKDGCQGLI